MKIDITHIAKLANLPLTDEERTLYSGQLSSILDYIARLNELNTTEIEETSQVTGLTNVLRDDKALPSLSQEDATSGSQSDKGQFKVKGIFDNE